MNDIFCQKCGTSVFYEEMQPNCQCEELTGFFSWVAKDSSIIHLFQGLNNLVFDDKVSIQNSLDRVISYQICNEFETECTD